MRLTLLAALVAGLAAGCTPARPPAPAVTAPPPLAAAAATFPLDGYLLQPAAANDLDVVLDRLTVACMRRAGQPWQGDGRNEFDLLGDRANRFGLADEGLAASFGYHGDAAPPPPPSPQVRRHLNGCASEAAKTLGWVPAEFAWLRQLYDRTLEQAFADPRASEVTARWSSCMTRTGFPYARPADAATDARWSGSTRPSADERRVARADVGCKDQVAFTRTLSVVLAAGQADAVRGNQARLDGFRAMAARAVAKADKLRGDHRAPAPGGPEPVPPGGWRTEHTGA